MRGFVLFLFTEDPPNRPMGSQKQNKAPEHLFTEDPPNRPMGSQKQNKAPEHLFTEDPPNRPMGSQKQNKAPEHAFCGGSVWTYPCPRYRMDPACVSRVPRLSQP
jgi:hypothetical protein